MLTIFTIAMILIVSINAMVPNETRPQMFFFWTRSIIISMIAVIRNTRPIIGINHKIPKIMAKIHSALHVFFVALVIVIDSKKSKNGLIF